MRLGLVFILVVVSLLLGCQAEKLSQPVAPEEPADANSISEDVNAVESLDTDLGDEAVSDVEADLEDFSI